MRKNILTKGLYLTLLLVKIIFILISLFLGILVFFKTLEYFNPDFSHGFLSDKEAVFHSFYKFGFYVHIISAPSILLSGIFLLSNYLREKFKKAHQFVGKIYVFLILVLAAPGGFVMAFQALGGTFSIINFLLIAILWWYFTFKAYVYIRNKNTEKHKLFMQRSMILTFSAIIFRLLAFIHLQLGYENYEIAYIFIVWLSWLPNLIIFELWQKFRKPESL